MKLHATLYTSDATGVPTKVKTGAVALSVVCAIRPAVETRSLRWQVRNGALVNVKSLNVNVTVQVFAPCPVPALVKSNWNVWSRLLLATADMLAVLPHPADGVPKSPATRVVPLLLILPAFKLDVATCHTLLASDPISITPGRFCPRK